MIAVTNQLHGSGTNPSGYTGTGYGFGLKQLNLPTPRNPGAQTALPETQTSLQNTVVPPTAVLPWWKKIVGLPAYTAGSLRPQPLGILGHTT